MHCLQIIGAAVGSMVASIDGRVGWLIDGFVRDAQVKSIRKIIGELEEADVASAFNATGGNVIVVGLSDASIVESLLMLLSVVQLSDYGMFLLYDYHYKILILHCYIQISLLIQCQLFHINLHFGYIHNRS